jgi:ferritin
MTSQQSGRGERDNKARLSPFNHEIEEGINHQIHCELQAWYAFTNLSQACSQDSNALHGFSEFFCMVAIESSANACAFMRYQNQRGGTVELRDIKTPKDTWTKPIESWQYALDIVKLNVESLFKLGKVAVDNRDLAFSNWLETHFMEKGTRHVKDVADILRQVQRVTEGGKSEGGQGIYELDREFRENGGRPMFSNRATEPLDLLHEIEVRQQQRRRGGRTSGSTATQVFDLVRELKK